MKVLRQIKVEIEQYKWNWW